ncbi:hypothetical protein MGMO_97c00150 [Methyloglobulus morosus KoM1]|uniref:Uncharacterized protein n=1 Tax=Methyloglobulus morosus KoM1 TaxID=1116472 RepID=V5BZ87_9GAMM|nr:hypothetical protein MGMO_97c00150 [Methyloglobulus morosus KoM1]
MHDAKECRLRVRYEPQQFGASNVGVRTSPPTYKIPNIRDKANPPGYGLKTSQLIGVDQILVERNNVGVCMLPVLSNRSDIFMRYY